MGITGLLPALKPIQNTKTLAELSGKTIAVDAYVWLHKGVYSCATDLALGKSTTRYVNYAMDRVHMLRHFKIEPYIVFDGGPLPAKKGTESERKKKREENLAKGKALVAQGRHTQARDCFNKCIDVTPQMAYQLIKKLRAEGVQYLVAPYEADAQLAYLERIGLVDGILTEDSDLLVFGCKSVFFKFDSTNYTVVSIERKDFASVVPPRSDIHLAGWTDVQFRSMAILSGCDYLPSIPGIGLKTACNLLRKYKTAEAVVKHLIFEGKKKVPPGYLEQYHFAEKCFQHQKVYCPLQEKLVPLYPVPADWTQEYEDYCGGDLDPALAKKLAMGDVDPHTLLPMNDINPGFLPGSKKHAAATKPVSHKGKGKQVQTTKEVKSASTGGILNFFGANPIIPPSSSKPSKPSPLTVKQPRVVSAGQASGKRTLAEVMDSDISRKKQKQRQNSPMKATAQSRFFGQQGVRQRSVSLPMQPHDLDGAAGPSRIREQEKENIVPGDVDEYDASDLSMCAQGRLDSEVDLDFDHELPVAEVEQEDGYMSPLAPFSPSRDAHHDLSSPVHRTRSTPRRSESSPNGQFFRPRYQRDPEEEDDFGEVFSSPTSANRRNRLRSCSPRCLSSPVHHRDGTPPPILSMDVQQRQSASLTMERVLVADTPVAKRLFVETTTCEASTSRRVSLDLRGSLGIPRPEQDDAEGYLEEPSGSTTPPTSTPETPIHVPGSQEPSVVIDVDELDMFDIEEQMLRDAHARRDAVMKGWREKWAHKGPIPKSKATTGSKNIQSSSKLKGKAKMTNPPALKRSHTNVTPAGRFALGKSKGNSANSSDQKKPSSTRSAKSEKRVSMAALNFFQPKKVEQRHTIFVGDSDDDEIVVGSSPVAPTRTHHQIRDEVPTVNNLARFR
ncbi:exodeoxyribonuclease 1 [Coprinopsis cinerea okayama7|uniref:Exodeoxyribonuclease 1 n=1 Tax=Coprinopsis cinerea (strain Okayama-7 / 130 / ATCC MYA-4618 / FGSC 9003) TaxID=240176 RepID=A8NBU0_COPC7|nr:exodeoxyribonuclease 1 [Coprinopsis cinerea okayama7\|eukprot:XP_001832288.2 exodeoxyribonuclease 1 [Coprinopsis cinerea okayama7\